MQKFIIPQDLLELIANYVARGPWREVDSIMQRMNKEILPLKEEEIKPRE